MNLLFDTNVLLYIIRQQNTTFLLQNWSIESQKIFVSIVTVAELRSISLQNSWGAKRLKSMSDLLEKAIVIEINENLANTYAEIDAYSQRRNPSYSNYSFATPRNMGKNDLWIASTAALLGLRLVTTDADFNHLHTVFLEVDHLNPATLK